MSKSVEKSIVKSGSSNNEKRRQLSEGCGEIRGLSNTGKRNWIKLPVFRNYTINLTVERLFRRHCRTPDILLLLGIETGLLLLMKWARFLILRASLKNEDGKGLRVKALRARLSDIEQKNLPIAGDLSAERQQSQEAEIKKQQDRQKLKS